MRSTYDIFFKTETSGPIKYVEMNFPPNFDLAPARLIERSGIGSGTLSLVNSTLIYTVISPVNVPDAISIQLEIGKIIALSTGAFKIDITTKNIDGGIIDGPTSSGTFLISDVSSNVIADNTITGNDISPDFTKRKTMLDDAAGNTHGWNPSGSVKNFGIVDGDVSGPANNIFVSAIDEDGTGCRTTDIMSEENLMSITCDAAPANNTALHYLITKLPENVETTTSLFSSKSLLSSSITSSPSPFDSLEK